MDQDATPESIEKALETSNVSLGDSDTTPKETPAQQQEVTSSSGYHNPESQFDTGFMAWLQVAGSFFLFFNSW
jgi:hypothetical protein